MQKLLFYFFIMLTFSSSAQNQRLRDFSIEIGILSTGKWNAITDVEGVKVGHTTLIKGKKYAQV